MSQHWNIPDLFTSKDGGTITTTQQWEQHRRDEILHLFAEHVYGKTPDIPLDRVEYVALEETPNSCGGKNRYRKVQALIHCGGGCIRVTAAVYIPKGGTAPYPAMLMIDPFLHQLHQGMPPEYLYSFFPPDIITDRGYAAVQVICATACPDHPVHCREGVLGFFPGSGGNAWGCIGAWAWSASRILDYLFTCTDIDGTKVAVSGCSRAGKTALWCGAQDKRFAVVMSNVSGCSGAALTRGKIGEHIADITTNYPFWFCPNYKNYAHDEDSLPLDQHMLLALAAPRPMYLASASEDVWADIDAEYQALTLAADIYRLYGLPTSLPAKRPGPGQGISTGYAGYHLRPGGHDLTPYDWEKYMDFCDNYLK